MAQEHLVAQEHHILTRRPLFVMFEMCDMPCLMCDMPCHLPYLMCHLPYLMRNIPYLMWNMHYSKARWGEYPGLPPLLLHYQYLLLLLLQEKRPQQ